MRLEMVMKQRLATELRMAPHIIQSIEVLTLPALELQTFIQQQMDTNPVLESSEITAEEESTPTQEEKAQEEIDKEEPPADEQILNDFENMEAEGWEDYYNRDHIAKRNDGEKDKKQEAMQNTPDKPLSLQDFLFQQFGLLDLPEQQKKIGEQIIYNIDANGYLNYPLEEILRTLEPIPLPSEAEQVLQYIQKLEPAGVGARNIQECLLLQLSETDTNYHVKKEMIEKYLTDISNNKYPKIAKELGRSLEEIKEIVTALQKLDPKPGANYASDKPSFVMPDVVVELIDGQYLVRLEEDYLPHLRINPRYLQMLQEKSDKLSKAREFLKKKLESANWIIEAIKQRQQTLFRVAQRLVEHQQEFLDHGLTHLKPLKMQDIADDLQIHVSTVSRAIADKYMQTPRGIFALKFFFTGSIDKKDGDNESRVTVQERVQEMIQQEDKKKPLSDEDIADNLKAVGLEIARRTVTKYRKALKIPSSRRRKQY
jgi:RNA polymerase sigma-54 factor